MIHAVFECLLSGCRLGSESSSLWPGSCLQGKALNPQLLHLRASDSLGAGVKGKFTDGLQDPILGFGVPYFNTFFLNGTLMK